MEHANRNDKVHTHLVQHLGVYTGCTHVDDLFLIPVGKFNELNPSQIFVFSNRFIY